MARMAFREKPGHLEDVGIDGNRTIKWILKEEFGRVWNAFLWFRITPTSGLLQIW